MFTLGNLTICENARSSLVISLYSSLVMRIHKLQSKNVNLFLGWASTLKSGQIMPAGLGSWCRVDNFEKSICYEATKERRTGLTTKPWTQQIKRTNVLPVQNRNS